MAGNIESSVLVVDTIVQADGRVWVCETHTDIAGADHAFTYLDAAQGTDRNAVMAARAAWLGPAMGSSEIAANVNSVLALGAAAVLTFVFSTPAQNLVAVRAAYTTATALQAVMIGAFASTLTDAQLQAAFGITEAAVVTLRANKLTPAAAQASAIAASTGV